ncbi:MAG: hypothetical protein C6W58_08895 [Bacillaceae bacterium]|jgi:hypothetical protein|nr:MULTISPECIES: hypothetical protein [Aeribacillus]AXI40029.1 hypothetical protein CX649_10460 [Bacillaceae bacterium ZC4]REJ17385.1 MAG: hypothetical protein C6W58_08895 [Bacillaceae bacterium]MDR9791744.1 hypothetical protein [Aeribacillus pallidus]MED0648936.1 hypothetical protein [Aeribacillus composti]MED0715869.1 hypothetical protein [Aeribacillus composti]
MNKKSIMKSFISIMFVLLLSGCLYPEERLHKNEIPYEAQIQSVQKAVEQYKADTEGLLPIKTRDKSTPIYEKYPIDFNLLIPEYLPEPPGTAFENGGIYLYVLVDVEKNPTVKLIDLRIAEAIRELKMRINAHEYPPYEKQIAKNVFTLNYKKLGLKEPPHVKSPYSGENLPLVIDNNREVYVDYSLDLYRAIKESKRSFKEGEDIRHLLVENSPFVPAFSLPYTVNEKNEPVFLIK